MSINLHGTTSKAALARAVAILVEGTGEDEVSFSLSTEEHGDCIDFSGSLEDIHRRIIADCDYEDGKWIYRGRKA